MNQVNQLFLDLAALVQLQGEMVENIDVNIKQAKDHVIVAEANINKALQYQKAARRVNLVLILEKMLHSVYCDRSVGRHISAGSRHDSFEGINFYYI